MNLSDPSITTEIKKIVSHYGFRHPKNFNEIEDIVQSVLCAALSLGYTELCPTYIKKSIHNRIIDLNLLHRQSQEHVSIDEFESLGVLKHSTPKDTGFDVRRAIEASHISGVNVMHLYFIEGMTCREIAEREGCTKQGVEGKLNRQIKRARKILGDYAKNFPNYIN